MSLPLFTNNAATALARGITPIDTILQLTPGTGSYFPQPTGGNYFMLTLVQINNPEIAEIVKCINRTGDYLTVERGQENTQPQIFNISDNVQLRITAQSLNLFAQGGGGGGGGAATQVVEFTATQGQTVFTIPFSYVPDNYNLAVFVNGSKQIIDVNYSESSSTSITFFTGLNVGDLVEVIYNLPIAAGQIDASNILYDEGGIGAVESTVQKKLQESVSVKDFGAIGDGSHDDTTAIQAALTAVSANGGAVYVPTGTYKISTTLQISGNTRLYGDGNSSVITTSSNIQSLTGSNTGSNVLYGVNIESIRFDNTFPVSQVAGPVLTATLTNGSPTVVVTSVAGLYNGMSITGTGIPTGTYIQVSNYSTAVFLRNSSGAPVNATANGSQTLSTFFAQGQTNFHIYFLNPEFPYLNNVEFTTSFTDVQYSPNNHAGLFLDTTGTGFEGNVTNCFFNHAQYQHNISDSRITNNVIWANPFDYALKINQPDTIVSNNSLSAGVVQGGLWVTTAAADSNITGNNIDGGSVWYTGYGITLNQTFSVNITGNRFNNIYKGGIYITDGSYLTITGNVFINTNYSNSLFSDIEIDDISFGTTHCTITGNTFYQSNTLTNPGYAIKEVNVTGGNPSANSYSCNAVSSNYAVPSMLVLNPYNIEQVANVGSVTNGLTTFTPTFVNLTLGNGTATASYQRTNSKITVNYFLTFGSTTSVSGPIAVTLPIVANASISSTGSAVGVHSGGTQQQGGISLVQAGQLYGYVIPSGTGTYWNATVPWTWAATDTISFSLTYII